MRFTTSTEKAVTKNFILKNVKEESAAKANIFWDIEFFLNLRNRLYCGEMEIIVTFNAVVYQIVMI
jgi:hypothetical protein